jgi:hypothetical protein
LKQIAIETRDLARVNNHALAPSLVRRWPTGRALKARFEIGDPCLALLEHFCDRFTDLRGDELAGEFVRFGERVTAQFVDVRALGVAEGRQPLAVPPITGMRLESWLGNFG